MSMYLPNPDVGPIGAEPGEFIDFPMTAADVARLDAEAVRASVANAETAAGTVDDETGWPTIAARTGMLILAVAFAALRPMRAGRLRASITRATRSVR